MPCARLSVAALAVLLAACVTPPPAASPAGSTSLVVFLVADQFRADYVQRYGHQWTHGLRRLIDGGAYFPEAAYTHAATKTCAGHMTISTGAPPAVHGIIDNDWYDRALGRTITCTHSPEVWSVAFGGAEGSERHGPDLLRVPTFADELKLQSAGPTRVLSLALKARSAIALGGQPGPGTMVVWEEDDGTFATSSAYATTPWPEVDAFVATHPIAGARDVVWDRLLPPASYLFDDDAPGEGRWPTLPRALSPPDDDSEGAFVTRWERSPWSNAYLADMAATLARDLDLGNGQGTDMLAVGFSGLDLVGHDYGPRSHEVQDTLARLDQSIGDLLDSLDLLVGPDRYVVAFSSDHGVPPLPEQSLASGIDAGRLSSTTVRTALNAALAPATGLERSVAAVDVPNIYFVPEVARRLDTDDALRAVTTATLLAEPGIAAVHWANELASSADTSDPVLARLRAAYVPGRSGEVTFVLTPYWVPQATGTTHGSPHAYDTRVPVIFYGAGIAPGRYLEAAAPQDVAPTLAHLVGITLSASRGRVLASAIQR